MKSKLNPKEVSRARGGPRDLKLPNSKEYAIQTVYALKRCLETLKCDRERVRVELGRIDEHEHWKVLGYKSREQMLKVELGDLSDLGQANAEEFGLKLGKRGRPKKGEENNPDNIRFKYGTQPTYLLARLDRDFPDIAEQFRAGEFNSVRQAAIKAGIVTPPDPVEVAVKAYLKLNDEQRRQFRELVS